MKKNNLIGYFFVFILGCASVYAFNYFFPDLINKTNQREYKMVSVTDTGIASGVDNIYDAVVVIENYKGNKLGGIGSGFIYNEEGYIITNEHVISGSEYIKIILSSGESTEAEVIGSDMYEDIAVIKIDKEYVSLVAKIGNSEKVRLGDTVFTVGSPIENKYAGTITRGILSGKNRLIEVSVKSSSNDWIMNVMQTDAAINPGNSGGPLCNVNGEVIGVNSMKIDEDEIEGIGFSIPIEDAIDVANSLVHNEPNPRAYIGITMADTTTSKFYLKKYGISLDSNIESGVIALEVAKDSPSEKAGILPGDVITKIGDKEVKNVAELKYYLYKYKPKDKVKIEIIRKDKKSTYEVTLGTSE